MKLGELSSGSLFKLGLACAGMFWLGLGLLFGVLALVGFQTVHVNREPVFGSPGFGISLLMAGLFAILSALAVTLGGRITRLVPRLRDITLDQSDLVGLDAYVEQSHPD